MSHRITSIDVDTAFEEAKQCSGTLEQLVQKAKRLPQPDPYLAEQIKGTAKRFEDLMQRYIDTYRKRYGMRLERTVLVTL